MVDNGLDVDMGFHEGMELHWTNIVPADTQHVYIIVTMLGGWHEHFFMSSKQVWDKVQSC